MKIKNISFYALTCYWFGVDHFNKPDRKTRLPDCQGAGLVDDHGG